MGQIRFDTLDGETIVSASLGSEYRGCGLGEELIRKGCQAFIGETRVKKIRALIKENNLGSIRAFEKAGFNSGDKVVHKGFKSVTMQYEE